MKHQIILLGKDITSVYHGVKEFGPDCLHLLFTEQTRDVMEPMWALLPDSIQCRSYFTEPYDGNQVMEICRQIHRDNSGDFMYHLSEGTKPMAMAAMRVAQEEGAQAFYLTQLGELVWLDSFEKVDMNSSLDNEELVALSGNRLSDYHDVRRLRNDDVNAARQIKRFIENHPNEYARIRKFFGIFCGKQLSSLPASKLLADELRFKSRDGELLITHHGRILLKINQPSAARLFFTGAWWEVIVADQARQWSQRRPHPTEAWHNVIFSSDTGRSQAKNEVDVLLNDEQKLIFIECKSGAVTQYDIYKIDGVRETYGGDISRAVLASYYPLDDLMREKCRDLQIHLFAPRHADERFHFVETLPDWLDWLTQELQL
ncbi:DUF1887 family CARF protein [Parabacteroides sp. OttesenSCG-928-N08]|nr:DUF1887 family CARF protein [Parabacteroides sp. OttesenSCG-928-N08]